MDFENRFSTIYRVRIGDVWYVFNRSIDLYDISNKMMDVLNAIGIGIPSDVISRTIDSEINDNSLEVLLVCYDLPNIEGKDQCELNRLKIEISRKLPDTYYRVDQILERNMDASISSRFTTGFRKGLNRWFGEIGNALYNYKKQYRYSLAEYYWPHTEELIDAYDNLDEEITKMKSKLAELQTEYRTRCNYIQGSITRQKGYLEMLERKSKKGEMMIAGYTTDKLREDLRDKGFKYIEYVNSELNKPDEYRSIDEVNNNKEK